MIGIMIPQCTSEEVIDTCIKNMHNNQKNKLAL